MQQGKDRENRSRQTSCHQCGICCTKGGAALHSGDLGLIVKGLIPRHDLITIRKGEFAHNPRTDKVQPTKAEIVKLRGTGREWTCCYYDPHTKGCTIYENRPLACGTLKCWDPEESLALVESDLLSRFDILEGDEVLLELVRKYERSCPLPDFASITPRFDKNRGDALIELEDMMNADLAYRNSCIDNASIAVAEEMFLFGRPLFQLLQSFDLHVFQSGHRLGLQWMKKR